MRRSWSRFCGSRGNQTLALRVYVSDIASVASWGNRVFGSPFLCVHNGKAERQDFGTLSILFSNIPLGSSAQTTANSLKTHLGPLPVLWDSPDPGRPRS